MAQDIATIYLASILLEKNRWNGKGPSLLVSDWMEPAAEAGFSGLEIWMNHLLLASREEWELIRQKAQDLALPVALISSYVPTDGSDKAKRLRDAVTETVDYFRPRGLKVNIGGKARKRASPEEIEEGVEFLRDWSGRLPRDLTLLLENHDNTFMDEEEAIEPTRLSLGADRFKSILHPFTLETDRLKAVLESRGDSIAHMHVQTLQGHDRVALADNRDLVMEALRLITARGYDGSWSLEFTRGTSKPGEEAESLFDAAERDLNFLVNALGRLKG